MQLTSRFHDALIFSAHLHAEQIRKGTSIPYITHPLAVAGIVLENGGNEDEAVAALLHDAVEDQGGVTTRDKIRQLFGDTVVEIVNGCTDSDETPKPPWRERKEVYLAHLKGASPSVRLVSCADKLHNARSILSDYRQLGDKVWRRFKGGKAGTLWYYRALLDTYRSFGIDPLVEELDRVVSEMECLANA